MAKILSNFDYKGQSPNFERDRFETLAEMTSYNAAWLSDGQISFCQETRKHYVWNSITKEWSELKTASESTGGGGMTPEEADAKYLDKTKDDESQGVITAAGFNTEGEVNADTISGSSVYAKDEVFCNGLIEGESVVGEFISGGEGEFRAVKSESVDAQNLEATIGHIEYASSAYHTIIDEIRSEEFAEGLAGYGFKIDKTGKAQMRSLELFESLIVPELRYNRVSVIAGEQWQSSGGGVIESVDTNADEFRIRLEKGEGISLEVDDICKGIYHTENGFQPIYFSINDIVGISEDAEGNRHGVIGYTLREGCDVPPQANMTFVAYGNFTNVERQKSAYSTTSYKRYLVGVNDWEIKEENIAMQFGDLSGLVIGGKSFAGYSAYLSNIYMTGVIKQLSADGKAYVVPAERGAWEKGETYYYHDRVSHEGCIWLCKTTDADGTQAEPIESSTEWLLEVSKGAQGISPNTAYKSTIFVRSENTPSRPTGGSYDSPTPSGWSDGVPEGDKKLWMSTRVFSSDGKSPQQAEWTLPQALTNTADIEIKYSSATTSPGTPESGQGWAEIASSATIWMAVRKAKDGVWGEWQVSKVKGERGEDGTSIKVKGTKPSVADLPTTPEDPSDCYIVGQNLYVWDGDSWVDAGQFKGDKGDKGENGLNGTSAYVHIKYANSLNKNDWSANNGEAPSKYIGIYTDNNVEDSLEWEKYSWKQWVGEDGFGYEYIYTKTTSLSFPSVPTEKNNEDGYVPEGWKASPQTVTATYPYCWMAYRQKTGGVWSEWKGNADDITKASLWAKYGQDGKQGAKGDKGDKGDRGYQGATGAAGRGIKAIEYAYQVSSSATEIPGERNGGEMNGSTLVVDGSVADGVLSLSGSVEGGVLKMATAGAGWQTNSPATTEAQPYLWRRTITTYTDGSKETSYVLLGVKGDKGTDGKSVEYIFRSSNSKVSPVRPSSFNKDDYVPTGWSDEPMDATDKEPYVWVSQRVKTNNIWGDFTAPTLWAKYSFDGTTVNSVINQYYLSTSPIEMAGGTIINFRPEWQLGKYLWTRTMQILSDGTTRTTDWICVSGSPGEAGKPGNTLRMRGLWKSSEVYANNEEFRDVVFYNDSTYICKYDGSENARPGDDDTNWEPFNEFENVATSVLLAKNGYIDVFGSGEIFVGQTEGDKSTGWKMTEGMIRHTNTGLTLTADGELLVPDGKFKVATDGKAEDFIKKVEDTFSSQSQTLSDHERSIGENNEYIASVEGNVNDSLDTHAEQIAALEVKDDEISATVASHSESISGLTGDVASAQSNISQLQIKSKEISAMVGRHTTTLEGQEESITTLQQTAEGLSATIATTKSNLEGQIAAAKTEIKATTDGITTRVSNAEGNISSLQQTANSLSLKVEKLEEPVNDNLLPNTDFTLVDTSKGEMQSPLDTWEIYGTASSVIADADHYGCNAIYINSSGGFHGVKCTSQNMFGLSAGEAFTISVYGKASSNSNAIQMVIRYLDSNLTEISAERKIVGFYPGSQWVRKEGTFNRSSNFNAKYMQIDIYSNSAGQHWFAMPKLEKGSQLTEWVVNPYDLDKRLLATGIDIEQGKVTVTADQFKVQDNSGEQLAVFENVQQADGSMMPMLKTDLIRVKKLEGAVGYFSGFILNTPIYVTNDNAEEYFDVVGTTIKMFSMRKESLSKYIIFSGNFPDTTSIRITLPSILPSKDNFTADELLMARGLVGEEVCVINFDATGNTGAPLNINVSYVDQNYASNGLTIRERGTIVRAVCKRGITSGFSDNKYNYREYVYWDTTNLEFRLATESGYGKLESEIPN